MRTTLGKLMMAITAGLVTLTALTGPAHAAAAPSAGGGGLGDVLGGLLGAVGGILVSLGGALGG